MFSSSSNFNRHLEKATSQLLLEPDWDSVLHIVDCIRQGDVQPKPSLQAIRKKVSNDNPHVSMFALKVLEAVVKNCGDSVHSELATKDYMEFMKDQAKIRNDPVKEKILELIQVWSHAFRNDPKLKAVEDTFYLLKTEGHQFPALKEADAMFDAEKAPEWKDAETCTRCRVQFGVVQRKHHCRNCGDVFCGKCTAKTSNIPKLGFEREVRVCDSCYDKIKGGASKEKKDDDLPSEYLNSPLSKQSQRQPLTERNITFEPLLQAPPSKSEQDQLEEDELQLALALSKSEHESKEKERERLRNYSVYKGPSNDRPASPAKQSSVVTPMAAIDTSEMDPELARYLNRHYWQQKSEEQTTVQQPTTIPSAPAATSAEPRSTGYQFGGAPQVSSSHAYQNGDSDNSQEQFLSALQGSLEIFVNRMRSNSQRGRPIANDSAVQSLFAVISEMHPQLMTHIREKEDARGYYESLQDKLTQLRDAREALDSLREEHREKKRREAEELERIRQIQMMQKLEIMRQKKHEYLEMQRQLALQRLQDQEREMAARFEQQKQLTHMRQMQAYGFPQNYQQPQMMGMTPGLPQQGMVPHGYNPQTGSADGSPVHRMADPYSGMPQSMGNMGPSSGMYGNSAMAMGQAQFPPAGPPHGPPASSLPPGGTYMPEATGQPMMSQTGGYGGQVDQGPISLPQQTNMGVPMTSVPNIGGYGSIAGQQMIPPINTAQGQVAAMTGGENQAGYASMPPQQQSAEYSPYNFQGLATALPSQPNQNIYSNQPVTAPQQFNGQGQQFAPPPQQPPMVAPYQQPPGGPAGQPAPIQQQQLPMQQPPPAPTAQQQEQPNEMQLISFD